MGSHAAAVGISLALLTPLAQRAAAQVQAVRAARSPTAAEVLHRAVTAELANEAVLEQYAWHEHTVLRALDRNGRAGKTELDEMKDVSQVNGIEYDRLIARDGKPLPAKDQAKEDRKQADFIRNQDSPQELAKQVRQRDEDECKREAMIAELPSAFDLELLPAGVPPVCDCYVLQATPRPGYHAPNGDLDRLRHVGLTAWIDRKSFEYVRLQIRILKPISIGWFLARIGKGGVITLQSAQVDGHWLPSSAEGTVQARLLLVKGFHLGFEDTDSDYRQFHSTIRIKVVPGGGGHAPGAGDAH